MLIVVDANAGVPAYRQLIDQIRFQIVSGILPSGFELPSTRALSQELGLNPMTVSKAYQQLEHDGFLERRPGLSLIVSDVTDEVAERERAEHLKTVLSPAVIAARQLQISVPAAAAVFRRLLEDAKDREEKSK